MKKKVIMFAAVCISMGLLAGCGDTDKDYSSKVESSSEEVEVTEKITEETTEKIIEKSTEKLTEKATEKVTEKTEENVLMYESEYVKITYLGEDENWMGPQLKLKIENLSDINLTVQVRDVSVNDMMVSAIFSSDVAAGKSAIDKISFMKSSLEESGIIDMEKVDFSFHIYNSDTFDTIEDTTIGSMTIID
jgi:outer membrane murein-binding lipoprotein Lpp